MQPIVPGYDSATNFLEGAASLACDEHEIVGFGSADSGRDGGVTVGFFEGSTTQTAAAAAPKACRSSGVELP
jgi:hypothetical protein